jgi:adenine phosphoribosyltransferase
MDTIKSKIRDIADFPKPGIMFKDITPLLADPYALDASVSMLIEPFYDKGIHAIAGMEARGFIFGSLAASKLEVGFIPLRKPGKLPSDVKSISYDLEYGEASLEIHSDAIQQGDKILIIDDLLATGGTAKASCQLVEQLGGTVIACAFIIELDFLNGREQLNDMPIHSLLHY